MNLQQSIKFLSQSEENVKRARTRLDKSVETLASFISEKGIHGEYVNIDNVRYKIIVQTSNVGSYKYLAAIDITNDGYECSLECSLEDVNDSYLHGDFHSVLHASTRQQRLHFALNTSKVIDAFTQLWNDKSAKFDNAACFAENVNSTIKSM